MGTNNVNSQSRIKVGTPFIPGKTQYKPGVKAAFFSKDGHVLRTIIPLPPKDYVKSYRKARIDYGITEIDGIGLFCYQHPWTTLCVCPFSVHMLPENMRDLSALDTDDRITIEGVLVDAATGIVRGVRNIELTGSASNATKTIIKQQLAAKNDNTDINQVVNEILEKGEKEILSAITVRGVSKLKK